MAENREPCGAVEAELDPVESTLRKWQPHRLPPRPNEICVNMTDFKAQLAHCQKLLDGGCGVKTDAPRSTSTAWVWPSIRAISITLQVAVNTLVHRGSTLVDALERKID